MMPSSLTPAFRSFSSETAITTQLPVEPAFMLHKGKAQKVTACALDLSESATSTPALLHDAAKAACAKLLGTSAPSPRIEIESFSLDAAATVQEPTTKVISFRNQTPAVQSQSVSIFTKTITE